MWVLVLTCFVKLVAISITVLAGFRGAQTPRQVVGSSSVCLRPPPCC